MASKKIGTEQTAAKGKETKAGAVDLTEDQLEDAQGGIALLLPAVQQAREAARKSDTGTVLNKAGPLSSLDLKTFKT